MTASNADRNLLFGVLAVQMEFITREQFIGAVAEWTGDESKQLAQILVDQGVLDEETRATIEKMVEKRLGMIELFGPLHEERQGLGDAEVAPTVEFLSTVPERDPAVAETVSWQSRSVDERYRILRPHGRGGLGQVSVALDQELHREVAVKELLERRADDEDSRARFELEAELTGSLEHPGIVPVYGRGRSADGRPYYAMRLIRGISLREAIRRLHESPAPEQGPQGRTLPLRNLIRRFVDVSNTVEYAHSRGVLHRDLKPANIMLGKYGETLLIDWGLAKAMGESEEHPPGEEAAVTLSSGSGASPTRAGSVLGTPEYMSPEQSEGQLDRLGPTSDIYSLGAILYTILTGKLPFERDGSSDMLERIRYGRFRRPRQIDSRIPRPLEGICLKAMALRPENRYQSAAALVSDIEHWLADEPVSAYRETPSERAVRWMRRHRTWTLAGAAAFVLVTIVSVVAAVFVNGALQQEQIARHDGLLRFRAARTAIDTWLTGAADTLKYYPGVQEARQRLLEKSAEDYEWLAKQVSPGVEREIERGRIYLRLGDVRHILGDLPQARGAYHSARLLFADLAHNYGDVLDCHLELANSHTKLGIVLTDGSDYQKAEESFLSAIARLRDLPPDDLHNPRVRDSLGTCLLNRGSLLTVTDRLEEAKQALQQSAGEFESVLKTEAAKPRHREGLATARTLLGQILVAEGHHQEALTEIQKAIQSFNDLIQQESSHPERWNGRAKTRICLADALRRMGRESEELAAYTDAIFDYQELCRALPDVPEFQENLALTQTDLAQLLHHLGRNVDAEQALNQALSVFTDLAARFSDVPRLREEQAACLDTLARAISDRGRNEEASQICRSAVDIYQALVKEYPDEPHYRQRGAISRSHLGRILHKLGDHEQATDALQTAIAALEEVRREAPEIPSHANELAFVYEHLGVLCLETGKPAEAEEAFGKGRALWQSAVDESPAPEFLHNLAWSLVNCPDPQLRDPESGLRLARRASDETPENATYLATLGVAHYRAGNPEAAVETLLRAVELRHGEPTARDWLLLAMAQGKMGQTDEALKSFRLGQQWMDANCPDDVELKRIRQEAESLLGLPAPSAPPDSAADSTD